MKQNSEKRPKTIEKFFDNMKKRRALSRSSTVARATGDGYSYVAANNEHASHLIKIEIYDMKKIKDVLPVDQWKHADVRVRYYSPSEEDNTYLNINEVLYNITKQIAASGECKKYFIENSK